MGLKRDRKSPHPPKIQIHTYIVELKSITTKSCNASLACVCGAVVSWNLWGFVFHSSSTCTWAWNPSGIIWKILGRGFDSPWVYIKHPLLLTPLISNFILFYFLHYFAFPTTHTRCCSQKQWNFSCTNHDFCSFLFFSFLILKKWINMDPYNWYDVFRNFWCDFPIPKAMPCFLV